jgi:hypothetical protein
MTLRTSIIFAPLFLEDHDRSSPALVDDFRRDLCAFDQWLSDENAFIAMNQPHVAQYDSATDVARETFDLKEGPVFHAILFAARFHYCVHKCFPP